MYLCNKERYGYLNVPAKPHHSLEDDRLNFVHIHLEALSEKSSLPPVLSSSPFLLSFPTFLFLLSFPLFLSSFPPFLLPSSPPHSRCSSGSLCAQQEVFSLC